MFRKNLFQFYRMKVDFFQYCDSFCVMNLSFSSWIVNTKLHYQHLVFRPVWKDKGSKDVKINTYEPKYTTTVGQSNVCRNNFMILRLFLYFWSPKL